MAGFYRPGPGVLDVVYVAELRDDDSLMPAGGVPFGLAGKPLLRNGPKPADPPTSPLPQVPCTRGPR